MLKPQDSGDCVLNFHHDDRQSCVEGTLDFQVGCGMHVGTAWHLKWDRFRPCCFLTVNAETIDNNYVAEPTENFYGWSSIKLAKQEDHVSSANTLAGKELAAPPTDVPSVRTFSRIEGIVFLHRLFPQDNQERLSVASFIVFEKSLPLRGKRLLELGTTDVKSCYGTASMQWRQQEENHF